MLLTNKKRISIEKINSLIFTIYILLIFEGAIRKWVFPGLSSPLYFIKDPFVLIIYVICFYKKLFPKNSFFTVTIILAFIYFLLMAIQSFFIGFPLYIGIYGWRNYFYFLPLTFIIWQYFEEKELIKIAKFTCLISIPIAILTYVQYSSSKDDYINKNVGYEKTAVFVVTGNIVRPSGTFSFTNGHSLFIASLAVMLLYNFYLPPEKKFLSKPVFLISVFSFFANLATCGSRGAYFSIFIIVLSIVFSSFFILKRKEGFKMILYTFLTLVMSIFLFKIVFDKQLENIIERQQAAALSEGSVTNRMLSLFIDFESYSNEDLTIFGSGLGLSSGGGAYLSTGARGFVLAESEWARNILEAGLLLGFIYIFFRVILTFKIFSGAIKSLSVSRSPIPFIMLGFVAPILIVAPVTGNGTTTVYAWLFTGFTLAACKIYSQKDIESVVG